MQVSPTYRFFIFKTKSRDNKSLKHINKYYYNKIHVWFNHYSLFTCIMVNLIAFFVIIKACMLEKTVIALDYFHA